MKSPRSIVLERRRMRAAGMLGHAGRVLAHERDGRAHHVRIVQYAPGRQLHVELWETHDRGRRARIVPLCTLVHLLQNIGADELTSIAARRRPGVAS